MTNLKQELYDTINKEYPSSMINNSRSIMKRKVDRFMSMGKRGVHHIQNMFGIDLDYIPGQDDGAPPHESNYQE